MKRPLLCAALFFCAGVYGGRFFGAGAAFALWTGLCVCAAGGLCWRVRRVWPLVFAAAALIGAARYEQTMLKGRQADFEVAEVISFSAVVINPQSSGYIVQTTHGIRALLYPPYSAAGGGDAELSPELTTGSRVFVTGRVGRTSPRRNPGGFDERMYYGARGVFYKVFADSISPAGVSPVFADRMRSGFHAARGRVAGIYAAALPEREASVITSIITGDRSALPNDIKDLYQAGGIYHILAISGLHIGIIAMFLNSILSRFFSPRRAAVVVILCVSLYCLFTGASPSTVRATLTISVFLFGRILFLKADNLTSIAFAALCILTVNPLFLWDAGFALSFAGVAGIAVLAPPLEEGQTRLGAIFTPLKRFFENYWVRQSLSVSAAVFFVIIPVCMDFLPRVQTYGVLVNLIVFPTFFLLVALGFAAGFLGLFWGAGAAFLCGGVYYLLRGYEAVLGFFARLPLSSLLLGAWPWYLTILYYAFLCAGAFALKEHGVPAVYAAWPRLTHTRRKNRAAALAFLLFTAACVFHYTAPRPFTLTMLDVGQGDAFVLQAGGVLAVIDGGGRRLTPIGENTGMRVVVPYLEYLAVASPDIVIATHLDYDHAAGIIEVLNTKNAKLLCLPITAKDKQTQLHSDILLAADRARAEVLYLQAGDNLNMGELIFTVLSPNADTPAGNANDDSLVLRVSYSDEVSLLLTGDITAVVEEKILSQNPAALNSDVLKLAHHGSRYSNSERFLRTVNPFFAIVSYSHYNNYGLPAQVITNRLALLGVPLYDTPASGAVVITLRDVNGRRMLAIERTVPDERPKRP